jgi:aminopeptidase N
MYSWSQDHASPAYTYGFAIGSFNEFRENHQGISLNYYSHNHSSKKLETIFDKTGDMLSFFEEKSGVPYFQKSYAQILIGNHYQEMSGFAVLRNSYGDLVLKDSTETNLISHELAHQWWGNMITCENWNHIWLNEGFATYMSAAYNEHRFGKEKYQANIESYYSVYEKIKIKGADKSLVFDDWSNPTADDRNLAYFKGAYVLHLLREELGDQEFWKGIKSFSQKYYEKSVTTQNLQDAMEKSANRSLSDFFDKWIY